MRAASNTERRRPGLARTDMGTGGVYLKTSWLAMVTPTSPYPLGQILAGFLSPV
jgi:hypothetical protein